MVAYYDFNIIPKILENFKIKKIVVSGLKNKDLLNEILNYNDDIIAINLNELDNIKSINYDPLDALSSLKDYDAIFIDDDANWYTVYNELNTIKNTNNQFPLVFICNNKFPNKRRDSYTNPNTIPEKFRQKYGDTLTICHENEKIEINDGFYHALNENTPKNGVATAIEDFLLKNNYIGIMKINFIDEITVLYPKLQINEKRIDILLDNINEIRDFNLSDKIIENKLLISHINKNNTHAGDLNELQLEISKKDSKINNYLNQLKNYDNKIEYQNSHITNIERKLSLEKSKVKRIEAILVNKENELNYKDSTLNNKTEQLKITQNRLNKLETSFLNKKEDLKNFKNQLNDMDAQLKNKQHELNVRNDAIEQKEGIIKSQQHELNVRNDAIEQKEGIIKSQQQELNNEKDQFNSLMRNYNKKLSEIEKKEYLACCFKKEIINNHTEISYLKNNNLIKKILSPIGYLYLILKSDPKEISLNLKLYSMIKDSECFNIGFYLSNNPDLIKSKWCKYFSPELHYVCKGFSEDRTFNKKYFDRTSKKDLLEYILNCDK